MFSVIKIKQNQINYILESQEIQILLEQTYNVEIKII